MFTGIIESIGEVKEILQEGSNFHYCVYSNISNELKVDQSLCHDGVCLTVTKIDQDQHWVTAIRETLDKSNLLEWKVGKKVNLERSMVMNGRLDGHIVQGHVDQTGKVDSILEQDGSWVINVEYSPDSEQVTVEKGSICLNGISLTCFNSGEGRFSVAIIPYTYENTNVHQYRKGDLLNLEFDIIGKYVQKLMNP